MNGISLCSGYGGIELGLNLALGDTYRTVCCVEREAYAAAVLVERMADKALHEAPVWDDIKTFDGKPYRGLVDIVFGGYPCQPFSLAGKRLGADDERHLWPDVLRIVREVQPRFCFFENVVGHLTKGYPEVRADLEAAGYRVEAGLYSAAEVGANHERKRLFILAHTDNSGCGEQRGGKPDEAEQLPAECPSWWLSEPNVGRVAHGVASRVDRLRAIGNGVVPVVAAKAFICLAAKLAAGIGQEQEGDLSEH